MLPLGLDTNHGYAKTPVVNSEVAKRRTGLEQRLATLRRWTDGARERARRAHQRAERLWWRAKRRGDVLYRALNQRVWALEAQGVAEYQVRAEGKVLKRAANAELDALWARSQRAGDLGAQEEQKLQRYCREQRELLRGLEDLIAAERAMDELDDAKDQVMTVCKVALANLSMWVRDQYFPASYNQATWARLAPFFRLPGRVIARTDQVCVELRPFNDRQMNRDLVEVCTRVAAARPRLPDGRCLILTIRDASNATLHAQDRLVA